MEAPTRITGPGGQAGTKGGNAATEGRESGRAPQCRTAQIPPGGDDQVAPELVLCRPVPERDLHNAWQPFSGWITRRTRAQYAMARVEPAEKGKDQTQRHLYLVRHELPTAPGVRLTMSFTHHATAVQRVTLNGKADLIKDVFKLVKDDLEQKDSD